MKLGEPDASGRRRPEPAPGTEFTIPCDIRSLLDAKYRKKVRRDTPAACAMSSTVVSSNPFSANRSVAASQIASPTN
jgi:NADPH-dependent glutamate synthase beta subunit-like oxidoreductase